jgi:signal transduction histidine kinase/CheY-like chemotaxis protein/streptogramin lyase
VLAVSACTAAAQPPPPEAAHAVAPGVEVMAPVPTPQFRSYGVGDGLPGGVVYAVVQDRQGNMWFGTFGGLVRYDGVDFKTFRHEPGDPDSLAGGNIYTLSADHRGLLWLGGINTGLSRYDPATGRFRNWRHHDGKPASLSDNEVWAIAPAADGSLWVATDGGLDRMQPGQDGFVHVYGKGPGLRDLGAIRALLAEPDGRLWLGTQTGIYLRQADGNLRRIPVAPGFSPQPKVWRIDGDGGDVRVAVTGGLLDIGADGVARPLEIAGLAGQRVMSSVRDRAGRLWIATQKGVFFEKAPGRWQRVGSHPLLRGGLPDSWIWQLCRDREGGLWLADGDGSVAYLPPGWDRFSRFTHIPDQPDSLAGMAAETVGAGDHGTLWVGGAGWVDRLDPTTGHVEHVVKGLRGAVIDLVEDARGRLWINAEGSVSLLDRGKLVSLDLARAGVTRPVRLAALADGRIFLATWDKGLFGIDPDSLALEPLPLASSGAEVPLPNQLLAHGGTLWYASKEGLLRLDGKTGRMRFVPGVPRVDVYSIGFDADGLWLATDAGLQHVHLENVSGQGVSAVPDAHIDHLPDEAMRNLMGIKVDALEQIWLLGMNGLWRVDARSHASHRYGPQDGLTNAQFLNEITATMADGSVYAASKSGVIGFRSQRLARAGTVAAAPVVRLDRAEVRRDGRVQALPLDGSVIRLGWQDRDLRVGARVASYLDPAANDYRFRLRGFDAGWVDTGSRGERDFAGLANGNYQLEVMAAGANGVWGHLSAPLRIQVQAPPWLRWWAWLVYAGLLALLVWLLSIAWRRRLAHRHRIQLAEQHRRLAEQASAAKSQFLATLSHEIRTPMTGVMGMAELLLATGQTAQQREYTEAMQRSGGLLLKLVNDALDLARIEAGKLELEPAPFSPRMLAEDVARLEQAQAQAKGLALELQLGAALPALLLGDVVRIKQVLFNLVNNALKFTERGSVTLAMHWQGDALACTVSDTGPGIPEANQARLFERFEQDDGPQRRSGSGLGLAICRELVALMGGTISLRSQLGQGSSFCVRLPLQPTPNATVRHARAAGGMTGGRALDVLLVEDDAIVAAVIRGLLEGQGHRVRYAGNGLQALAELAQGSCDAVLLDLDLPGVDGLQVARLIRQGEVDGRRVWIIAITARSGGDEEARSRAAGMDGFLRKPLTGAQLAEVLAAVPYVQAAVV